MSFIGYDVCKLHMESRWLSGEFKLGTNRVLTCRRMEKGRKFHQA